MRKNQIHGLKFKTLAGMSSGGSAVGSSFSSIHRLDVK
jgi:hypothetical protein